MSKAKPPMCYWVDVSYAEMAERYQLAGLVAELSTYARTSVGQWKASPIRKGCPHCGQIIAIEIEFQPE